MAIVINPPVQTIMSPCKKAAPKVLFGEGCKVKKGEMEQIDTAIYFLLMDVGRKIRANAVLVALDGMYRLDGHWCKQQ